ncbi:leucine-rich repeat protein [Sesbania bispinosa]|nr:leucine-rich repeat protein [Sesbania bispinosa]
MGVGRETEVHTLCCEASLEDIGVWKIQGVRRALMGVWKIFSLMTMKGKRVFGSDDGFGEGEKQYVATEHTEGVDGTEHTEGVDGTSHIEGVLTLREPYIMLMEPHTLRESLTLREPHIMREALTLWQLHIMRELHKLRELHKGPGE